MWALKKGIFHKALEVDPEECKSTGVYSHFVSSVGEAACGGKGGSGEGEA